MLRRSAVRAALTILALGLAAAPANSAEPVIPTLWDTVESFRKPALSALPRLRFLTTTDFPPFNFLDGAGRLSGFNVDLARAVCAELEITETCQIQALPWNELDAALAAGNGEAIIAGTAVTRQSREKYAFSRPYLVFPARFLAPKSSDLDEPLATRLAQKRIGVVGGSAHERMLRAFFPAALAVTYPAEAALLADLGTAKIDAAFGDGMRLGQWLAGPQGQACCRFAGGPYIGPDYLGFGLSIAAARDDTELVAAFDYALHEISVKGIFAELYLRHFPVGFF